MEEPHQVLKFLHESEEGVGVADLDVAADAHDLRIQEAVRNSFDGQRVDDTVGVDGHDDFAARDRDPMVHCLGLAAVGVAQVTQLRRAA